MPTPAISLPLSGGHWMVTPTPSTPLPAEKCVGCDEVIAGFALAQATGDEFGITRPAVAGHDTGRTGAG
ncbi:hypothetical protein AB0H73_15720 [Streptomyces olivoreticuli]|uniref:hypothetical protein n=1 Tax=Streptomyces olivoreticuli TaxID=68246 RepID=UPI000E268A97|nr:hypothetical protein [Streptomyces olivoreticuli]